jgi:hypothetical protein
MKASCTRLSIWSAFGPTFLWLALASCLTSMADGAITDFVDFSPAALTDQCAVNVQTSPSPYSLAAIGLGGSQGVDLATTGDATLVYKTKGYNLAAMTSLDVTCFLKKQSTSGDTTALTFALVGASSSRVNAYDTSGTTEDSYLSLRLGRNTTSPTSLHFESQHKPGDSASPVTGTAGANLSLTNGNWYQFRATFVRMDANTIQVSGSLWNADATGIVGTQVSSFAAVNLTVPHIAGDAQVWLAIRGFANAGADAWDNLAITQNGVTETSPAAPGGFTVTPRPGHGVDRLARQQ